MKILSTLMIAIILFFSNSILAGEKFTLYYGKQLGNKYYVYVNGDRVTGGGLLNDRQWRVVGGSYNAGSLKVEFFNRSERDNCNRMVTHHYTVSPTKVRLNSVTNQCGSVKNISRTYKIY